MQNKSIFDNLDSILAEDTQNLPTDNREIREKIYLENGNIALFIWDDEKSRTNFIKHGVHFGTGIKVFEDIFRLESNVYKVGNEERFYIIGKVGTELLSVFAEKTNDSLCTNEKLYNIITSRKATNNEKEQYNESVGEVDEIRERRKQYVNESKNNRKKSNPYK